ncbi:MAG: ABC transporter substrate-binding protein [Azospirillaceae bacterium]|nr:ABC transporter substrate-binding protein [Azospirillaceae bacterium]
MVAPDINRRRFVTLAAGAAALVGAPEIGRAAEKPAVVRIGYLTAARAWTIGMTDGSFDAALGTKVEWVTFPAGGPALSLLAARQIDFAIFGITPIAAGLSRKLPIEILGSPEIVATSERLIVKPGIAGIKDLEGKRIAVAPSSTMSYALEAVIRINNLDSHSIKRLPLTQPDTIAAWRRGDIDATYINGPFWGELLADGGKQLLVSADLQPAGIFVWNSAVVRKDFADGYPETVVAWLQTVQAQFDRYKADPDGVSRALAKAYGAPFEAVRDTLAGLHYPSFKEQLGPGYWGNNVESGKDAPMVRALDDVAKFLADTGEIQRDGIPGSFAQTVNYDLLNKAFPA